MAGVTLEYDASAAIAKLQGLAGELADSRSMFLDMGEHLLASTKQRFRKQTAPDGKPWQPLRPSYQRRKRKNSNRILVLDGYLQNLLRYLATSEALVVGSDRVYAAIHQLGGTINIAARSQNAFFRQNKKGNIGQRFVKKANSNFAQRVTIGPYSITIPARPFLGVSKNDENVLLRIAKQHLNNATR